MADKPQKTQLLTDAPPEVQAAIDRQSQPRGGAPQQGQATAMLEAPNLSAQQRAAVPAMMQNRPAGSLPPMRKKSGGVGRWIAGPLISIGVAAGTAALAGVVMPPKPKVVAPEAKVMGKLQLATEPPGASVTIDGKPFPHFTPTDVEAAVGSTVRIGLKLDGYQPKEEEVVMASGERPMSFKLDKSAPAAPPPATAPPPPAPVAAASHDHHHSSSSSKGKEPAGKGTLNVFVRPWAIVYIDGARLRQTPVQNYELGSGKHVVELVNDPKGKREKLTITLKAGESQEIRKDWDK
jgi:hypothetical protein